MLTVLTMLASNVRFKGTCVCEKNLFFKMRKFFYTEKHSSYFITT
jgi:hypothetical protein